MVKLDEIDLLILKQLEMDAKITKKQISKKYGIALTTVHNRISRLEKEKIIKGYTAIYDWQKLGMGICAYIQITVNYCSKDYSQLDCAKKISALDGVKSCAIVAGTSDILVQVRKKDTTQLNDFVLNHLRKIAGIDKTTTQIVLSEF